MIRKLKTHIRNHTWKFLKAKWELNSKIKVVVENDNDWFVFNEIFTNKEYDAVLNIIPSSINNPLILDLGANVGYFALRIADELLSKKVNEFTIHSIEASFKNFRQLKDRINQTTLIGKCEAKHGLVGRKDGFSFLNVRTDHFGYHVENENMRGEKVYYIDIAHLLKDDLRRITLLKCDIEGSEESFLSHYPTLLHRVDLAVFEFHTGECDVPRCKQILFDAGLKYVQTLKSDLIYQTSVEIFKR